VGLDNLNAYYDQSLKRARLDQLLGHTGFSFQRMDIADREAVAALFAREGFRRVVHLAAQAGVRYSLENPFSYVDSNLVGFATVLEGCRHNGVEHLVYASSSSVYGLNSQMPFSVRDNVDHPISLYAATKKANELMAHAYSHLYRLPTTGLRFFTVYGPWGRPDMAMFLFSRAILEGKPGRRHPAGRSRVGWKLTRSLEQPRPLSDLQHRQPQPGGAAGADRGAREGSRAYGRQGVLAATARRRPRDGRRGQRSGRSHRLRAQHAPPPRRGTVR